MLHHMPAEYILLNCVESYAICLCGVYFLHLVQHPFPLRIYYDFLILSKLQYSPFANIPTTLIYGLSSRQILQFGMNDVVNGTFVMKQCTKIGILVSSPSNESCTFGGLRKISQLPQWS